MCGILAVLCNNRMPASGDLHKIMDSGAYLRCRGPDFCTAEYKPTGITVFHRLCINDISEDGNQPMVDGTIRMMCNGEIYNYKELVAEHKLQCKSKSDCEVILHLYKKFGFVETVKRLYGVFAIVLIDHDKMFMARDRIGVRPLYKGYTKADKFLAVASVPNALASFCTDIMPILPGTCSVASKEHPFPRVLYEDSVVYGGTDLKMLSAVEPGGIETRLRNALIEAVKLRLVSDRPIGCLLSGGLDSSIITAILVRLLGPKNVRTYSIGMEGSTDLRYARKVAAALGTVHHEVVFTPAEGFLVIPEVIQTLASYDITTVRASVGMYLISQYISKNTQDRVIFSGEGSDEILEGYLYFHNAPTPEDGARESVRLIQQMHQYDVLRADRCISANGLEPRVPFLDRKVVDIALGMPPTAKAPQKGYEKYILRKAFEGFLPLDVLWRRKEGFSDGVSSVKKAWYHHIQEFVEKKISDEMTSPAFPSKEALYYKLVFDHYFPYYNLKIDYWMPKWSSAKDPSGRLITAYDENKNENQVT